MSGGRANAALIRAGAGGPRKPLAWPHGRRRVSCRRRQAAHAGQRGSTGRAGQLGPGQGLVQRAACGGRQLTQAGRACGSRGRPSGGRHRATSRGPSTHLKRRRDCGDSVAGPEGVAESVTAAQDRRGLRSRIPGLAAAAVVSRAWQRAQPLAEGQRSAVSGRAGVSRRTQLGHGGWPQLVGWSSELPAGAGSSRKPPAGGPAGRAGRRLRGGGPCAQLVR